jgi:hypothetical protein
LAQYTKYFECKKPFADFFSTRIATTIRMGLFDTSESVSNDINQLPIGLQNIYKTPYRVFGLDESTATISMVRDSFRKICLIMSPHFSGLGTSRLTVQQLAFAYYLIRGAIKGSLGEISELVTKPNQFLDFRPEDILPLLRPMKSAVACSKEYRGFRMLSVACVSCKTVFSFPKISHTVFVFDVHYCMRKHSIERDLEDFQSFKDEISKELITIPIFPEASYLSSFGNSLTLGEKLAEFIMRIHVTLANRLLFSPRLLKFLGIDFTEPNFEYQIQPIFATNSTKNQPVFL